MSAKHLVIDGSNIATEGRSTPSLEQLESAVAEIKKDMPDVQVTVVVDATFAHRIEHSELERFEAAALEGAYVSPPAGAIGRGDAFLLRIAEKVNATVLSNDSFQEFHGEHPWLFEPGRLLGGTPVPGIGWIFVPRSPVRGPRSRVAVRDASRAKSQVERAIADAVAEVTDPGELNGTSKGGRRRGATAASSEVERTEGPRPEAVNEPMAFISFIAEHPLGAVIEGVVDSFTSHGAVILSGAVRCYVPLSGLAEPPPRSAREVLHKGEERHFVVTALDPYRRGVELALPDVGIVRGVPSEETVLAEVAMTRPRRKSAVTAASTTPVEAQSTASRRTRRRTPTDKESPETQSAETQSAETQSTETQSTEGKSPKEESPKEESPKEESPKEESPKEESPKGESPAVQVENVVVMSGSPARRPRKAAGTKVAKEAKPSSADVPEAPAGVTRPRARRSAKSQAALAEPTTTSPGTPTKGRARTSKAESKAPATAPAPTRRAAKGASTSTKAAIPTPAPARRRRSPVSELAPALAKETVEAQAPRRWSRSAS